MKIASLVCAYPPYAGGIAGSAKQINQILESQGHSVTVFAPSTLKPWLKLGHGAFMPQLLWRLRGFDCLYLHYPFFGTAEVVWLFKLLNPNIKLIIHYHMDVRQTSWLTKLLSLPSRLIRSSLLKQAKLIISASFDYLASSQIKKYFKNNPQQFLELPFAIDTNYFQPKLIHRHFDNQVMVKAQKIVNYVTDKFIRSRALNLIFVGGLDQAHYFKGVDNLLQALFLSTRKNWRLKIVGSGNLRPRYEALTKKLLLTNRVKFTGRLSDSDLLRALQNADLLILPSINSNEAFGIVLIEALACGVPVLASDLPGVRSVFTDGQEGLLVAPNNIEDLREKIDFILDNETIRKRMAQAARDLAVKRYDNQRLNQQLFKLFRSL
ncbi:MAG: glycosyltransferase family 4 protein [Patescibacteria group bacterium]|jgi:glycosyltransferase involved in cell wall biosynthesis